MAQARLPATLRTTNYAGSATLREAAEDAQTVHRRSVPDENDVVFDIAYRPTAAGAYERSVAKYKLFRRTRPALEAIERRQKLERFGAPKGAQGMERGVSMVSHDEVTIEDPLSEDANKTGEERMIEKIKATVKSKGAHRAEQEAAYDYDTYVSSRSSANSQGAGGSSNSRRPQSTSRYGNNSNSNNGSSNSSSPGRFRSGGNGNSQGPSPARQRYGGQNASPGRYRPGTSSNPRHGGGGSNPRYGHKHGQNQHGAFMSRATPPPPQ